MTNRNEITTILSTLGLTPTESLAYVSLLEGGPATGYETARRMSIARANAYSALDALVQRRLVERELGRPARFRAVEPAAFIGRLASDFATQLDELQSALDQLSVRAHPPSPVLERIESEVGARATIERIAARAQKRVSARLPDASLRTFEPFSRGLGRRGIAVDVAPTSARGLGSLVVDDRWAAVWLVGGTGLWGDEPFLVAVAQHLLGD